MADDVTSAPDEQPSGASHPATWTRSSPKRDMGFVAIVLLAMVSAWILGTPRSAGPDEPGHNVRAGALARGQLDGEFLAGFRQEGFELPAHIGFPPPDCFAFESYTPATCSAVLDTPEGTALLTTRASDYPIWGHLLPGLGTLAPGSISAWTARAADALVPMLLVAASVLLAARRGALGTAVTMLALTPMAWFTFGTVNPSGLAIAGGLAVWTGLSALAPTSGVLVPPDRLAPWLTAVGWAALVLPRRDGLVWASLILALAIVSMSIGVRSLATRLGSGPLVLVGVSTAATLAWASRSDTNDARALFLTPLAPVAAVAARRLWWKLSRRTVAFRWTVCSAVAFGSVVAMLGVMSTRTNGFDRLVLRLVIGETGNNLRQAIGVLGWLDAPVPVSAMFICVLAVGALAGVGVLGGERQLVLGMVGILTVAVLVSWTLTMLQNNDSGRYWQGRYYLPLLTGIPVLAARLRLDAAAARRLGLAVLSAALVVTNVGLASMLRRFSTGIAGTLLPWEWDTYEAPLPPVLLVLIHVGASVALVVWASRIDESVSQATSTTSD